MGSGWTCQASPWHVERGAGREGKQALRSLSACLAGREQVARAVSHGGLCLFVDKQPWHLCSPSEASLNTVSASDH